MEDAMRNRISDIGEKRDTRIDKPRPVGEILLELLAQFERRFPGIQITVVKTNATAV
jgi:hypothetical protein